MLLGAWLEYKKDFWDTIDPRTYPIWANSFIFNVNLVNRALEFQIISIKYLNDLITPTGGLHNYENFVTTYSLQISLLTFIISFTENGKCACRKD